MINGSILNVPHGHGLAIYTRVQLSSLKTTVRKRYGRRCSIRSYDMTILPLPGVKRENRARAYAYADGDLSFELSKAARRGSFTAIVARPWTHRPEIVAIVSYEDAIATSRRARMLQEDAEWEAMAPNPQGLFGFAC